MGRSGGLLLSATPHYQQVVRKSRLHKPGEVVYPDASQRDNREMVLTISIWSTAPLTLHRWGNGQERVNGLNKQHSQLKC